MLFKKLCFRLFTVAAMGLWSVNVSAILLANPSFEDPVVSGGPPVGSWEAFSLDGNQNSGPDIARNSVLMPRTGAQSLELIIDNSTPNIFAVVFQDITGLSVGELVSFTGWNKSLADSGGIEIRIEWRNFLGDLEVSRTPNLVPTPGVTYEMFTLDSIVPADADTARVVYAIQSFGGAVNQQVYVDDVALNVLSVPEPATLALMGLGLAGIGYRRQRSMIAV